MDPMTYTPLKLNMEPEKKSLEKEIPFGKPSFSGSMLNFGGVIRVTLRSYVFHYVSGGSTVGKFGPVDVAASSDDPPTALPPYVAPGGFVFFFELMTNKVLDDDDYYYYYDDYYY